MRYMIITLEGDWDKLQTYLNYLPSSNRVVSIHEGRHGKWNGLAEEYEFGFKIVIDTEPQITVNNVVISGR